MEEMLSGELGKDQEIEIVEKFISKQKRKKDKIKFKINIFLSIGILVMIASFYMLDYSGGDASYFIISLPLSVGLLGNVIAKQLPMEKAIKYYLDFTEELYGDLVTEKMTFYRFLQKMEVDFKEERMIASNQIVEKYGEKGEDAHLFYKKVEKDFFDITREKIDKFNKNKGKDL